MHISTRIVVFLLVLNMSAAAIGESGVADSWGVDPNPGMDKKIEKLNDAMKDIDPSSGLGSTLFGMYTSITTTFKIMFDFVIYGPMMFHNLGVPGWLTGLLFAPQYLIAGTGVYYGLTGRRI